jgi:hypothetical protein
MRMLWAFMVLFVAGSAGFAAAASAPVFNVKTDYGATGKKEDDAQGAIQKAIDACAAAGGGTVYLPPGDYTSGTLYLKSHVRLYLESGATLYASTDRTTFQQGIKAALLYGEDLENISIEGRGTIDGQGEYDWRMNDLQDDYIRPNAELAQSLGKPLMRSFPKGFPRETVYPRMVLLLRCRDVRIAGLSFLRSPSWTINPYACERLVIDGVYIYSSLKKGVWADGIDPDGCKDVRISNCTIETGDDALVFYSAKIWGPALPCENITVTNCRLTSASSAIKFCDGNWNCVRNVTIDNCVITGSNRGIAFMVFDGGYVSDVVLSNLTIECIRHDWFWWGDGDPIHFNIKRRSEISPQLPKEGEPAPGSIRNVILSNIIAHGKGTCFINGHPESPLAGVTLENVRLFLSHDPAAYGDKTAHAMKIQWAKNLKLRDVEVIWDKPASEKWESALYLEDVKGLVLDGFSGKQAKPGADSPAVILNKVEDAVIRNSKALEGTAVFLRILGETSRGIWLQGNDFRHAQTPYLLDAAVKAQGIKAESNLLR